jgi:rhomboid-related protein 1/2/3
MVHGNLRFFFMYQLGVVAGSLCFVLIGGGQGALVGCSGGVYAIFGIHLAELIMNWGSTNKGILNHWTRLLIIAIILGMDFYLHEVNPSTTTSYTAHVGGFMGGAVMGLVLLDNLEVTWTESHVIIPAAWAFAIAITTWAVYNYAYYFPPEVRSFVCLFVCLCDLGALLDARLVQGEGEGEVGGVDRGSGIQGAAKRQMMR